VGLWPGGSGVPRCAERDAGAAAQDDGAGRPRAATHHPGPTAGEHLAPLQHGHASQLSVELHVGHLVARPDPRVVGGSTTRSTDAPA
jgi:hypothetical protein